MSSKPLWEGPDQSALIPATVETAHELVVYGTQLTKRDKEQIVKAFQAGSFEMASTFVWAKAMAALRRQLAALGMEFVGEMLGRPDITEHSSIDQAISDFDVIRLSADLGMMNSTEAMRLGQTLQTITHFANRSDEEEESQMLPAEAMMCLRTSIQSILGLPHIGVASRFTKFRRALESRDFDSTDPEIESLLTSPYIFRRTTLSILLAKAKIADGAELEHALANLNTILPLIWDGLRKPEKWQTGQTYAEVYNSGKSAAVAGVKKALLRVKGFDFVPENLRSNTFSQAARKVLEAHEGFNNFYNEAAPLDALASLGTSIPPPAIPICMRAILSVRLGNPSGHTWATEHTTKELLSKIPADRWEYYLNDCLPRDESVLTKLTWAKPIARWREVVAFAKLRDLNIKNAAVRKLIEVSASGAPAPAIEAAAKILAAQAFAQ